MNKVPGSIIKYLKTLEGDQHPDGYLCLNENLGVIAADGCIGNTNLSNLDRTADPVQSIPLLQGLIPEKPESTTIINYVQTDDKNYFDIHLFGDYIGTWVIFINSTSNAHLLQEEQQIRLTGIYQNDKLRTGN